MVMHFATIDDRGVPTGFYRSDVHGESIPSGALALSDEEYVELSQHPGRRAVVGEEIVEIEPATGAEGDE